MTRYLYKITIYQVGSVVRRLAHCHYETGFFRLRKKKKKKKWGGEKKVATRDKKNFAFSPNIGDFGTPTQLAELGKKKREKKSYFRLKIEG